MAIQERHCKKLAVHPDSMNMDNNL